MYNAELVVACCLCLNGTDVLVALGWASVRACYYRPLLVVQVEQLTTCVCVCVCVCHHHRYKHAQRQHKKVIKYNTHMCNNK